MLRSCVAGVRCLVDGVGLWFYVRHTLRLPCCRFGRVRLWFGVWMPKALVVMSSGICLFYA